MKSISTQYNASMTLALACLVLSHYPLKEQNNTVLVIESFAGNDPAMYIGLPVLGLVISIVISMHMIKSLWNRTFVNLCNWKVINLAESYAIILFFAIFVFISQ